MLNAGVLTPRYILLIAEIPDFLRLYSAAEARVPSLHFFPLHSQGNTNTSTVDKREDAFLVSRLEAVPTTFSINQSHTLLTSDFGDLDGFLLGREAKHPRQAHVYTLPIPNQLLLRPPIFRCMRNIRHHSCPLMVRNEELEGIIQSLTQLEFHWNHRYHYPWVFFNDQPFSLEFKTVVSNLTSSECFFEEVPKEHWSTPKWVDEGRFMDSLEYLGIIGVGKGWMKSYHHMCRWNSGFFYKHPKLQEFDYYWRVEPDCHFFCDIDYDVFAFMRDKGIKYGFNMNILDDARSFPSLWSHTKSFIDGNPHFLHTEADLSWLLDTRRGFEYNNCQFFSNFEIGDLNFFRGEANEAYFEWLDRRGGFFYERFGDAPVHTLSVAMFLPKSQIHFFQDIGYQHDINRHCPAHAAHRCDCEPTGLDENFYKLVPLESPQMKPEDTCIRGFLGTGWLEKKEGWNREFEIDSGGDGYHGYRQEEVAI
ncbi:MAG: hypothetical protein Q9227_006384 [Pyrenula ochraceoflavens]